MLRTFNCGIGLIVIADAEKSGHVIDAFGASGEKAVRIGTLVKGDGEAKVAYRGTAEAVSRKKTAILISGRGSNMGALIDAARGAGLSRRDRAGDLQCGRRRRLGARAKRPALPPR